MITDDALREAAFTVDQAMLETLPIPEECTHTYSPTFEKKMRKLIHRTNRPVFYKALYRAACILIAITISVGLFLTFHTEARAAVEDWVKAKVGDYLIFSLSGKKEITAVQEGYCISWIPDGYTLLFSALSGDNKMEGYMNEAGQILTFNYIYRTSNSNLLIGAGKCEEKYIATASLEAIIYLSKDSKESSSIVWYTDDGEILLCISGYLGEADLIRLAESVYMQDSKK